MWGLEALSAFFVFRKASGLELLLVALLVWLFPKTADFFRESALVWPPLTS